MQRWPVDRGLSGRIFLTFFLLAAVYAGFIAVLWAAGVGFFTLAVVVALMLFFQYYFSDRLILLSMKAREVSPEEAPFLHDLVTRLAMLAGIPKPRVAVVPTMLPNAFATGRSPSQAVVAVTQGLLERLETPEVEAVLAHELSHVKNRDVAVLTWASFFATVAALVVQNFYFLGMTSRGRDRNAGALVLVYFVALLVWVISYLLIRALSRYREFAADRGAAFLTGAPANLESALVKISGSLKKVPPRDLREVEAFNAFFILPALGGEGMAELFATHPSLERRLAYLRQIERELARIT